jgi:uncharacterized protein
MLTIAVDDLERSLAFYGNGLGLPTQGIVGREFTGPSHSSIYGPV